MTDTLFATGSFDFNRGSFVTEYVAYVLGPVSSSDPSVLDWRSGSAKIYDLNPVYAFGHGSSAWAGGSAEVYVLVPFGGFEDFAIYPSTNDDPLNGFVVASQAGNSAGVGQPWTRHYLVAVPPRKARFAVPHIKLGAMTGVASQYLDAHQLEVLRRDQSAPTTFGSARSIIPTVRPARLNYATGSTHVTNLIPGRTYTASADVLGVRESFQFTPMTSTYDLVFSGTPTKILVEEGTKLGDYFDGNSGPDYLWEQNGTPGSTRSYYYPDRALRHSVLVRTLQENVALGITVEDPVYAVLPSPSSTA